MSPGETCLIDTRVLAEEMAARQSGALPLRERRLTNVSVKPKLVDEFLDHLVGGLRPQFANRDALARLLDDVLDEAHRRWPRVRADEWAFVRYLATHTSPELTTAKPPAHAVDLYLAFAATSEVPAAIAAISELIDTAAGAVMRRFGLSSDDADDIAQHVREKLLVVAPGQEPKLGSYQGTGNLPSWIRAVIAREALGLLRRQRETEELDHDVLAITGDPHLSVLKGRYRAEFERAFKRAVAGLKPRDRTVLKTLVLDGASVGQIAKLCNIHRVTASRWLARIRSELLAATRRHLAAELELSSAELDSVLRLLGSRLDVSLRSVLG